MSSFWVMLNYTEDAYWAQVGWIKWGGYSTESIFLQYLNNSHYPVIRYLNCSSNTWQTTPACEPSSSKNYQVEYSSGNQKFSFTVNGYSAWESGQVSWTANEFEVGAEIRDGYHGDTTSELGKDHSPGHLSNHIHAEDINVAWAGVGVQDGVLTGDYTQMHYQHVEKDPGYSSQDNWFRPWDDRCDQ